MNTFFACKAFAFLNLLCNWPPFSTTISTTSSPYGDCASPTNGRMSSMRIIRNDFDFISSSSPTSRQTQHYDGKSNGAVIYHTVYDFNGNKLNASPESFLAKQQTVAPAGSSGATYIWECQHCHEKRNSRTRPSELEFTCHGRGERPGFGSSHKWVKIGQVY